VFLCGQVVAEKKHASALTTNAMVDRAAVLSHENGAKDVASTMQMKKMLEQKQKKPVCVDDDHILTRESNSYFTNCFSAAKAGMCEEDQKEWFLSVCCKSCQAQQSTSAMRKNEESKKTADFHKRIDQEERQKEGYRHKVADALKRSTGTCLIVSDEEILRYRHHKLTIKQCEGVCNKGKDRFRRCTWRQKQGHDPFVIRPHPIGVCEVRSGDNKILHRDINVRKHDCVRACKGHTMDAQRVCEWCQSGNTKPILIRKPSDKGLPKAAAEVTVPLLPTSTLKRGLPDLSHMHARCCTEQAATCMACKARVSKSFFCKHNPGQYGCAKVDRVKESLKDHKKKMQDLNDYDANRKQAKVLNAEETQKRKSKYSRWKNMMAHRKYDTYNQQGEWRLNDSEERDRAYHYAAEDTAKKEEHEERVAEANEATFKAHRQHVVHKKAIKREEIEKRSWQESTKKEYERNTRPGPCFIANYLGIVLKALTTRDKCHAACTCDDCTCAFNHFKFRFSTPGFCTIRSPRGLKLVHEKMSKKHCQFKCSAMDARTRCEFGTEVLRRGAKPIYLQRPPMMIGNIPGPPAVPMPPPPSRNKQTKKAGFGERLLKAGEGLVKKEVSGIAQKAGAALQRNVANTKKGGAASPPQQMQQTKKAGIGQAHSNTKKGGAALPSPRPTNGFAYDEDHDENIKKGGFSQSRWNIPRTPASPSTQSRSAALPSPRPTNGFAYDEDIPVTPAVPMPSPPSNNKRTKKGGFGPPPRPTNGFPNNKDHGEGSQQGGFTSPLQQSDSVKKDNDAFSLASYFNWSPAKVSGNFKRKHEKP
jgi:hypothetical protein